MNSPYTTERTELIKRINALFGYPVKWLESQPDKVLKAIFYKARKRVDLTESPTKIYRKQVDGISYVLADSGEWEEEQN